MPTGDRKLDEFESMFRSAVKDIFHFAPPELTRAVLLTDLDAAATDELGAQVARFLASIDQAHELTWTALSGDDWSSIDGLLAKLEAVQPQLIVTYRNLRADHEQRFTLGAVVDVLTQATPVPVLLLPPPGRSELDAVLQGTDRVMVVTDHITGDDRLVNWGVHFTHVNGQLFLAHVEDDTHVERLLDVIGKIRSIDSDAARRDIPQKLLALPREYIDTVHGVLQKNGVQETIVPVVVSGHALGYYKRLMTEHDIDLLVLNTKDQRQDAMHAMAHALSVEIRHRPLLLL